jgi:Domain of unknown function (DUF4124)
MKFRLIAALIFFVVPGLSYLSADVYRWADEQGNMFYGNTPPSNARNVKLMFKESASAPAAGEAAPDEAQRNTEAIVQELEEEKAREEEARKEAESVKRNAPPGRDELIAREKVKLEKKIAELEAMPLDYFGSQNNKRVRIGYYQYRLDALMSNPDEYFANPESFEGNVKTPDKKQ